MSKSKNQTPITEDDDSTTQDDQIEAKGGSKAPSDAPLDEGDDDTSNILSQDEQNSEFFAEAGLVDDGGDDDDAFVEGGPKPGAKVKTPAEVAAEALAAQSAIEASNVAKGLNPDGTAKEPTPSSTPAQPELDAQGKPIVTPPAAAQPQVQTPPASDQQPGNEQPPTPEQVQEYYRGWRDNTEQALAQTHYKLSQEQLDELDANPAEFLPKMMAKVYLDALTASLAQVNANLPRLVNQINEQAKVGSERESKFWERWPDLKENVDVVLRLGSAYRQNNPGATEEDFINEVGAAAMVTLRKPMPHMNGNGNGQQPAAPQKPFKPAASSPASGGKPAASVNPFEQLNESFDDDVIDSD